MLKMSQYCEDAALDVSMQSVKDVTVSSVKAPLRISIDEAEEDPGASRLSIKVLFHDVRRPTESFSYPHAVYILRVAEEGITPNPALVWYVVTAFSPALIWQGTPGRSCGGGKSFAACSSQSPRRQMAASGARCRPSRRTPGASGHLV